MNISINLYDFLKFRRHSRAPALRFRSHIFLIINLSYLNDKFQFLDLTASEALETGLSGSEATHDSHMISLHIHSIDLIKYCHKYLVYDKISK